MMLRTQDPPQYMEKLLAIHTDYSRIVSVAFSNDPNFSVELDKVRTAPWRTVTGFKLCVN